MPIPIEQQTIIDILSDFTRCDLSINDDAIFFKRNFRDRNINLTLSKLKLDEYLNSLNNLNVHEETAIYNENYFEIIVKEESSLPMRRLRDDKIQVYNSESDIKFELSPASDEYLIWLLNQVYSLSPSDFRMGMFMGSRLERLMESDEDIQILEFIRLTNFRFITLKIESTNKSTIASFLKLTHSFLFHISYNMDIALVPHRSLDELSRSGRITRMRRSRIEDLDPPRRFYNEDLVHHYLLAVSTDSHVIEFLSYYHILEHYFESVFNDDLINSIRNKITNPGFSYKRNKDITQLINSIKKALQIRSETITFSEIDALKLCLKKYVNISELKDKIDEYDENLLMYYKNNKVIFSNGPEIDFENNDLDLVIKNLSNRIYNTRNALVHSKDGDKSKFTPFKDDRILFKEIPLLRFIGEMVIISESTV